MKELSIQEKAKRYDEAIKRAKEINNEQRAQPFNIMTRVFPELKESEDERIRKRIIDALHGDVLEMSEIKDAIAWLEKQSEQTHAELGQSEMTKTSDKELEPKFHPGDWVIDNFGNTYQIETATEIESEHIFGYTIVGGGYFNDNSDVRLWTIKDAKAGDVLVASDSSLFILSKVVDTAAFHYFSLCKNGSKEIGDGNHAWKSVRGCHPATKKERELLYAKMKEAGYEWDADKKELKQIKDNTLEMRGNQVVSEIVKNQKEIPGEFTKLVHENFWDLIKTEHKMLDADKVIEWFRVNWWDSHIGDPIDKFKKDFGL